MSKSTSSPTTLTSRSRSGGTRTGSLASQLEALTKDKCCAGDHATPAERRLIEIMMIYHLAAYEALMDIAKERNDRCPTT